MTRVKDTADNLQFKTLPPQIAALLRRSDFGDYIGSIHNLDLATIMYLNSASRQQRALFLMTLSGFAKPDKTVVRNDEALSAVDVQISPQSENQNTSAISNESTNEAEVGFFSTFQLKPAKED